MVEKIVAIALGIVILVVLAIALTYIALMASARTPGASQQFAEACARWALRGCSEDADVIAEIDDALAGSNKTTLTELCEKEFLTVPPERNITMCADVCKNRCLPKLSADLAAENALFVAGMSHGSVKVTLTNRGSLTLWGVSATVFNNEGGPHKIRGSASFDEPGVSYTCGPDYCNCTIDKFDSHTSITMRCDSRDSLTSVLACVDVDPDAVEPLRDTGVINETKEDNNCKELEG